MFGPASTAAGMCMTRRYIIEKHMPAAAAAELSAAAVSTTPWMAYWDDASQAYYYQHDESGETTWDEPAEGYKEAA